MNLPPKWDRNLKSSYCYGYKDHMTIKQPRRLHTMMSYLFEVNDINWPINSLLQLLLNSERERGGRERGRERGRETSNAQAGNGYMYMYV